MAGTQLRDTGLVFTTVSGGFLEPSNINRTLNSLFGCRHIWQENIAQFRA
jgi:hypothetical protein